MFKKSLKDGYLDLHVVSVFFVGLDSVHAKNVVFQEPTSLDLAGLKFGHSIYFRPQGQVELKRIQPDNYNEAILHALTFEKMQPPSITSQLPSSESFGSLQSKQANPGMKSQLNPISESKQNLSRHSDSSTSLSTQQTETEASYTGVSDAEFLKKASVDTVEYFKEHLTDYKNKGKMEFFNVFYCDHFLILKEIFKIFIKNLSLSVLVASESGGFSEMDLDIIAESSSFASKGLIMQLKSEFSEKDEAVLHKFKDFLISDGDHSKLTFSLNYKEPQTSDYEIGVDIASHALHSASYQSFPFDWYLFGFNLYKYMVSNNLHAMSVSKDCMIIAKELDMDRPTVEAALEHLTQNNIIVYFGDILNDHVFASMKQFITFFGDLYEYCSHDRLLQVSDFELIAKKYFEGYLSVHEITMLFKKLLILTPCSSSDYIIPSFLPVVNEGDRKVICEKYSDGVPLYIECPSAGYEYISMLTVYLLINQWKLFEGSNILFKNCIALLDKTTNFIIAISFSGKYIEVHAKSRIGSYTNFSLISDTILRGLEKIKLLLSKRHEMFDFKMSFRCKFTERTSHTDYYSGETNTLICGQHEIPLDDSQKRWIGSRKLITLCEKFDLFG